MRAVRAIAVALGLATACADPNTRLDGEWIGDVRYADGAVDRMELLIDSGGRSVRVSIPRWALARAVASRLSASNDSIVATIVARDSSALRSDTVMLRGVVRAGAMIGEVKRGAETGSTDLRQLQPPEEVRPPVIGGTYRTADNRLLGIAPFSEFGSHHFIIDYSSGRIGPLYPIARNRWLVGKSLIAPMLPADTLEIFGRGIWADSMRLVAADRSPVLAERVGNDQEVYITTGEVVLHGTLTRPADRPPYPALVLVHGSGPLSTAVFGPWTRYFAGLGFAVLTYDKRGVGQSTGDWQTADFPTLARDVLAAVRFLARRQDIRADRIGLWGASQGGWIAPIVASTAPEEIAFLVIHAGSGTTVRRQGELYVQHELRFAGLPESSVAIGTRYQQLDDAVTENRRPWGELSAFYERHRVEEAWLWPPRPADDWFRPYYRMLMDFDPAPYWARVRCPVLLFFGELDANVPPRESWPPIERALRRAGNQRVARVVLPNANHLFLAARTGTRDEYPGLSRFVPGYFDTMARWLNEVRQ